MESLFSILEDFIFGYLRRLKVKSRMEEVVPIIESFGDKTSSVIKNYEMQCEKYLKILVSNKNWRNDIVALSILVNEKNHNLRIFVYFSEEQSYELMYYNLVELIGLPPEITMNLGNFATIYSRLRQNYL